MGRSHTTSRAGVSLERKILIDFSRQQHAHACTFRNGNLITFYHDRFYCITIPFSYREAAAASYILGDTSWVICCFVFWAGSSSGATKKRRDILPASGLFCVQYLFYFGFLLTLAIVQSKLFLYFFLFTYGEGFLDMACTGFLYLAHLHDLEKEGILKSAGRHL